MPAAPNVKFAMVTLFAVLLLAGCDFPRDAEGTLDRVRKDGVLRVGVTERPPWVYREGQSVRGIEPRIVDAFARTLGAAPEWIEGSESALAAALKARRIDLMIGGHTRDTPWQKHAGRSVAYRSARLVVAVPQGAAAPAHKADLDGVTLEHHAGRPDIGTHVADAGGKPLPTQRLGRAPAAIYDFESAAHALTATTLVLHTDEHIILIAPGENRLALELDRFLAGPGRRLAQAAPAP